MLEDVKMSHQDLRNRVVEIFFRIDPVGINFGDNLPEYSIEADTIVPQLKHCSSSSDLRRVIVAALKIYFDLDETNPATSEKLDNLSQEIWLLHSQLLSSNR